MIHGSMASGTARATWCTLELRSGSDSPSCQTTLTRACPEASKCAGQVRQSVNSNGKLSYSRPPHQCRLSQHDPAAERASVQSPSLYRGTPRAPSARMLQGFPQLRQFGTPSWMSLEFSSQSLNGPSIPGTVTWPYSNGAGLEPEAAVETFVRRSDTPCLEDRHAYYFYYYPGLGNSSAIERVGSSL